MKYKDTVNEFMERRASAKDCAPIFPFGEKLKELKMQVTDPHAWIGQTEVIEKLRSALLMKSSGFNVAVIGSEGTGRTKTLRHVLEEFKPLRGKALQDLVAFCNPKNPAQVYCTWVPQGYGRKLKVACEHILTTLQHELPLIPKQMQKDEEANKIWSEYRVKLNTFISDYQRKVYEPGKNLYLIMRPHRQQAQNQGLQETDNTQYTPETHGKFDFRELSKNQRQNPLAFSIAKLITCTDSKQRYIFTDQIDMYLDLELIEPDIAESAYKEIVELGMFQQEQGNVLEEERDAKIDDIVKSYQEKAIEVAFSELEKIVLPGHERFSTNPEIDFTAFVADMKNIARKNLDVFMPRVNSAMPLPMPSAPTQAGEEWENISQQFSIHVLVDNADMAETPVVFEKNADWKNALGTIARKGQRGMYKSDHTDIQAGSLLRAHGGFWVIDVKDIAASFMTSGGAPFIPELLKAIGESKIEIKNWDPFSLAPTQLSVQSVPFKTKCVMLLSQNDYMALSQIPSFRDAFKGKVEFENSTDLNEEAFKQFHLFVHKIKDDEHLKEILPPAIEELASYASRLANNKKKISLAYGSIADVMRDANNLASSAAITAADIRRAIQHKNESVIKKAHLEYRLNDMIVIHTDGERIGELTALAVLRMGNAMFGITTRAAVNVSRGDGVMKVTNIDAEADMAGHVCEKSFEIVKSALKNHFDVKRNFDAEFVFEQSYDFIDGDSASLLMYCVLISALANIPLKQQYAMTGRISLRGEVGPIGGVNEKIEGWFDLCAKKGLTGSQGVVIPKANMLDLNLRKDVVEAIEQKRFHIFPVETAEEALEILTERKAGSKIEKKEHTITGTKTRMTWEPDTVYEAVEKRLKTFEENSKSSQ